MHKHIFYCIIFCITFSSFTTTKSEITKSELNLKYFGLQNNIDYKDFKQYLTTIDKEKILLNKMYITNRDVIITDNLPQTKYTYIHFYKNKITDIVSFIPLKDITSNQEYDSIFNDFKPLYNHTKKKNYDSFWSEKGSAITIGKELINLNNFIYIKYSEHKKAVNKSRFIELIDNLENKLKHQITFGGSFFLKPTGISIFNGEPDYSYHMPISLALSLNYSKYTTKDIAPGVGIEAGICPFAVISRIYTPLSFYSNINFNLKIGKINNDKFVFEGSVVFLVPLNYIVNDRESYRSGFSTIFQRTALFGTGVFVGGERTYKHFFNNFGFYMEFLTTKTNYYNKYSYISSRKNRYEIAFDEDKWLFVISAGFKYKLGANFTIK